jgi:hypothetical protein
MWLPESRKRVSRDSFRLPHPGQLKLDMPSTRIRLPEIGRGRFRNGRKGDEAEGVPKSRTVKREADGPHVLILFEGRIWIPVAADGPENAVVGVDAAVTELIAASGGGSVRPLNPLKKAEGSIP